MECAGQGEGEKETVGRESETGSPSWLTKWKFIGAAHRSRRACGDAAAAQRESARERGEKGEKRERGETGAW